MPNFISRVFSRRGRSHDETVPVATTNIRRVSNSGSNPQQNAMGLTDICTQVAESLLADERQHQIPPDAARLERMCLANFSSEELKRLIENGSIFEVAVAADLLIQLGSQNNQLPEQVFAQIAPFMKPNQQVPQVKQQEAVFQRMQTEAREHQGAPSVDQIRTVLGHVLNWPQLVEYKRLFYKRIVPLYSIAYSRLRTHPRTITNYYSGYCATGSSK